MEENYKGYTIKIEQDEDPESPREWDNMGIMVCKHDRYELGDKNHDISFEYCDSWNDVKKEIIAKYGEIAVIIPLKLYDHSGITIYCADSGQYHQHEAWDSGYVGFIFISKEKVRKEYSVKKISQKLLKQVEKCLRQEVETYDTYLTGQVVGYIAENEDDPDFNESCWGYYDQEDAITEAKSVIDGRIEELERMKEAKTRAYIKNNVPLIYRTA